MSLRNTKADDKIDEVPLLAPGNRVETNLVSGKIGNWAMVSTNYITYTYTNYQQNDLINKK